MVSDLVLFTYEELKRLKGEDRAKALNMWQEYVKRQREEERREYLNECSRVNNYKKDRKGLCRGCGKKMVE